LSEIRATTISDAAGTGPIALTGQEAAKAYLWHSFSTTIRDSFNISSTTDLGTGIGRADLTSAMGNAYPIINHNQMGGVNNTIFVWNEANFQTASKWEWNTGTSSSSTNTLADNDSTHTVHGDLA
jgi:hypothetical protein